MAYVESSSASGDNGWQHQLQAYGTWDLYKAIRAGWAVRGEGRSKWKPTISQTVGKDVIGPLPLALSHALTETGFNQPLASLGANVTTSDLPTYHSLSMSLMV
ncbi:hypothetical protein CVT26_004523 [Gymnopilus dilepis]|uniref:Uncharacterized protein n=1 Tax=Gymnopilus dilepis TaxID=231916 RepID=A0A409WF21_9AGAR|nr:hypothetical protein CVT26_004523 [Gymnopilus dilepis]